MDISIESKKLKRYEKMPSFIIAIQLDSNKN